MTSCIGIMLDSGLTLRRIRVRTPMSTTPPCFCKMSVFEHAGNLVAH